MRKKLLNEDELKYFKLIVNGHSNLEIRQLFFKKYGKTLTEDQVNNQKRTYKLKSNKPYRFDSKNNPNYKPIWYEYITPDGYILVKVGQPSEYKLKHHIIWEKYYGKIPDDSYVMFLDQDKTNFDINNLKLIKKQDLRSVISKKILTKNKTINESYILLHKLINKTKQLQEGIKKWKIMNNYIMIFFMKIEN